MTVIVICHRHFEQQRSLLIRLFVDVAILNQLAVALIGHHREYFLHVVHIEFAGVCYERVVIHVISIIGDIIIFVGRNPFGKQLVAIVLRNDFKPHSQSASKTEVLQLGPMCFTMRHEDIDVNLVYQFYGVLAVSIILVVDSLEQRIALPIQILLRNEGVPAKNCLSNLLVCIEVEFHGDRSISVG